jgi:Domain of unknown function (DUF4136)
MTSRFTFALLFFVIAVRGEVKTKQYTDPEGCIRTYRLATGRVLTSRGLVEDPTVNAIMKEAVSAQMNPLKISEAGKGADLEIRFMGGNSAGLQVDDLAIGDVAMWDIGGPQPISGRTYKKSNLVIAAVDNRSNRTIWAARCTDKFGDPNHLQERVQKAVAKAFAKFPKKLACST